MIKRPLIVYNSKRFSRMATAAMKNSCLASVCILFFLSTVSAQGKSASQPDV